MAERPLSWRDVPEVLKAALTIGQGATVPLRERLDRWQVAHSPVLLTPYRCPWGEDSTYPRPPWVRVIVAPVFETEQDNGPANVPGTDRLSTTSRMPRDVDYRLTGLAVIVGTHGLAVHRNDNR